MLRVLAWAGFGLTFLLISAPLRATVMDLLGALSRAVEENSPWSYVAIGVAVLLGLMYTLHRAAQPRI